MAYTVTRRDIDNLARIIAHDFGCQAFHVKAGNSSYGYAWTFLFFREESDSQPAFTIRTDGATTKREALAYLNAFHDGASRRASQSSPTSTAV